MARQGARIVIAEPWSVLRRGLVGVLHGPHLVVADVDRADRIRTVTADQAVDLIIVGFQAGVDLPAAVSDLAAGAVPVLVLADDLDVGTLRSMLQAGASGVLATRVGDAALLDAVGRLLDGDRVVDQAYLPLLFGDLDHNGDQEESLLTPREREVLAHLAKGLSNREIAEALVVGESTVKTHLANIYAKLEVDSRHQAVGRALELGLLT